jgi:hypothetical protein
MSNFTDLTRFDTEKLSYEFANGAPFQHLIIDDFLHVEIADALLTELENDN